MIPKVVKPREVTKFKHISLCNVIYMSIIKIKTNRLKQILYKVMFPTQNAFIPNRFIMDKIIIGYEYL